MSDSDKKRICNGCGPQGTFDFIPEHILGVRVSEACQIHDYMYHFAKARIQDKEEADRVFLNNLIRIIDAKSRKYLIKVRVFKNHYFQLRNPLWLIRRELAYRYYQGVKKFGGPAFWAGKNDIYNLKTDRGQGVI
jgi:hypothetical protein